VETTKSKEVLDSLESLQEIRKRIEDSEAKQKEEAILREAEALRSTDIYESVDKF
jgi:hypothetical protein